MEKSLNQIREEKAIVMGYSSWSAFEDSAATVIWENVNEVCKQEFFSQFPAGQSVSLTATFVQP